MDKGRGQRRPTQEERGASDPRSDDSADKHAHGTHGRGRGQEKDLGGSSAQPTNAEHLDGGDDADADRPMAFSY